LLIVGRGEGNGGASPESDPADDGCPSLPAPAVFLWDSLISKSGMGSLMDPNIQRFG